MKTPHLSSHPTHGRPQLLTAWRHKLPNLFEAQSQGAQGTHSPTHLRLVDVVHAQCLKDLGLHKVPDASLGHDRDGDGGLDGLDHGGVGHPGHTPVLTDVRRHPLQSHHGHSACLLGDAGLLDECVPCGEGFGEARVVGLPALEPRPLALTMPFKGLRFIRGHQIVMLHLETRAPLNSISTHVVSLQETGPCPFTADSKLSSQSGKTPQRRSKGKARSPLLPCTHHDDSALEHLG
eukprot:1156625-Pelagomonas_calceolata.AAC.5